MDEALDGFIELEEEATAFYRDFTKRVNTALLNSFRVQANIDLPLFRQSSVAGYEEELADALRYPSEGDGYGVETVTPPQVPDTERPENVFRKEGDGWLVRYESAELPPLKNLDGMHYIAHLLAHEGEVFTPFQLRAEVFPDREYTGINTSAQARNDRKALEQYNDRLKEINEELGEARAYNDSGRIEKLEGEKETVFCEIRKGLPARQAKFKSEQENARKAVSKAINKAYENIKKRDAPKLLSHLTTFLLLGNLIMYSPDRKTSWHT